MTCFACGNEPTQQCPRCGRPYCDEHGEDFCDVCLEPSSGIPSFNLYRGSLLALIVGAVIALYLILQPAGGEGDSGSKVIVLTPTAAARATPAGAASPQAVQATATGTPAAGARTPTPATGTPRPAGTGTPVVSTPGVTGEYVVEAGDTISGICGKIRKPPGMDVSTCVDQVQRLNNLSNPNAINIGDRLKVPQ